MDKQKIKRFNLICFMNFYSFELIQAVFLQALNTWNELNVINPIGNITTLLKNSARPAFTPTPSNILSFIFV